MNAQGIASIFCFFAGIFGLIMWGQLAARHRRLKAAYRTLIRERRS